MAVRKTGPIPVFRELTFNRGNGYTYTHIHTYVCSHTDVHMHTCITHTRVCVCVCVCVYSALKSIMKRKKPGKLRI